MNSFIPLTPKNSTSGLQTLLLGRVSTEHQDLETAIADVECAQRYLKQIYPHPCTCHCLTEQASGMLANRQTMQEAEELLATNVIDLVLVTELRAIFRNPRLQWAFIQDCVDCGVRVISIADQIDTADVNWKVMTHVAMLRHGLVIRNRRVLQQGVEADPAVIRSIITRFLAGESYTQIAERLNNN